MPVEVFFVPQTGLGTLSPAQLLADLTAAGLVPETSDEGDTRWIEFQSFQSRLVVASADKPLEFITLEFSGQIEAETPLIAKVEETLVSRGYSEAPQFLDENA